MGKEEKKELTAEEKQRQREEKKRLKAEKKAKAKKAKQEAAEGPKEVINVPVQKKKEPVLDTLKPSSDEFSSFTHENTGRKNSAQRKMSAMENESEEAATINEMTDIRERSIIRLGL